MLATIAPRLAIELPDCDHCTRLCIQYVAGASLKTYRRERSQRYAEDILAHHRGFEPRHEEAFCDAIHLFERLSHGDRLYAAICAITSAERALARSSWVGRADTRAPDPESASEWVRDLTCDGDVESNPGPRRAVWPPLGAFCALLWGAYVGLVVVSAAAMPTMEAVTLAWSAPLTLSVAYHASAARRSCGVARCGRHRRWEPHHQSAPLHVNGWVRDLTIDGDVEPNPGPGPLSDAYVIILSLCGVFWAWAAVISVAVSVLRRLDIELPYDTVVGCPVAALGTAARWLPRSDGDYADCNDSAAAVPVLPDLVPDGVYEDRDGSWFTVHDEPHGVGPFVLRTRTRIEGAHAFARLLVYTRTRIVQVVRRALFLAVCHEPRRTLRPRVGVDVPDPLRPVQMSRGQRVLDVGPVVGAYRWATDAGDVVVVVCSDILGVGSTYNVTARDWAALGSNSYNSKTLDAMTTYHERGHADRGRALVERAGVWTAVPPLLRRGGAATNAAYERRTDPPKAPNVATERTAATDDRTFVAVGNDKFRVETSDETSPGYARPLELCRPLDGVAHSGAHRDQTASATSVMTRLIEIDKPDPGPYTEAHRDVATRLGLAMRAANGNRRLSFAFYEKIAEHFTRPGQKINLFRGTGPMFNALVLRGSIFVKMEHLKLKSGAAGVKAGDPRNITSTPNVQAAGLTVVIETTQALAALGVTCGGYTMDELCERLAPVIGDDGDPNARVVPMDAYRCDGCVTKPARSGEETVVRVNWDPETVEAAVKVCQQFYNLPCERGKDGKSVYDSAIKYQQGTSRASGAPDTYYGNTLNMALIAARVAMLWGLPIAGIGRWFAAAGDDTVWRFTSEHLAQPRAAGMSLGDAVSRFRRDIEEAASFWGHVFEYDEPQPGSSFDGAHAPATFIPFLGRFFHGVPLRSFADPRRKIKSLGISYSTAPVEDVATGKGLGLQIDRYSYPWAYLAAAVSNMHATGRHEGLSDGDAATLLRPHLPYHIDESELVRLPPPQSIGSEISGASIELWDRLCPGYDASPFIDHCMRWEDYRSVAAFFADLPAFRTTVHLEDSALTRIDGEWQSDVPVLTAELTSEYLRDVARERAKLRSYQEEDELDSETDRKCYGCGQPGHEKRNCPEPGPAHSEGRKCYGCGSPSHEVRHCPQRMASAVAKPRQPRASKRQAAKARSRAKSARREGALPKRR